MIQERQPPFLGQKGTSMLEGELNEINKRLVAILDSIYDGLYITDGQANTILINQAYQVISGLKPDEVMGKNMHEVVSKGLIDRSGTLRALEIKAPVTLEQTFRTGKQALITSTPCFNESGEVSMVITVVRDMTELYGLQEKYRESEERRKAEMGFLRRHQQFSSCLVANDPKTVDTLNRARKVAALDTTILLLGETGVGKEQFARFIYENSQRSEQSFISINCGAIPPTLIESELFGYERGAFTGAKREGKMGVFESADNGTVFLDEIGDLPLEMQVHLLRVLQEMQITRVGGTRSIPVNVRIIAATNRDLLDMVHKKTFREDLYYRLNVIPIEIPPLRERPGDVVPLVQTFLRETNKKYRFQKVFSPAALQAMQHYNWPGNVRELKNVVEQAVILSDKNDILPSDLPIACCFSGERNHAPQPSGAFSLKREVARFEYQYICQAYEQYKNVRDAAASLGMDGATFVRKRKKYEQMLQK